jgi:hypothetical protein
MLLSTLLHSVLRDLTLSFSFCSFHKLFNSSAHYVTSGIKSHKIQFSPRRKRIYENGNSMSVFRVVS